MARSASSNDYKHRDLAILRHIADARIGMLPLLGELYFFAQGGNGGHVVKRLAADGLVELMPRAIPGGISYCRLTLRGAARIDAPKTRAGVLNTAALNSAIAIAYWAYLAGSARRYRLESREVGRLLGGAGPRQNVPHVITDEVGHPAIMRVYLAHGATPNSLAKLRGTIDEALAEPKLRPWIKDRDYGFAALAPTQEACQSLETAIDRAQLRERALVIVGLGPSPETLASTLRRRKKGSS